MSQARYCPYAKSFECMFDIEGVLNIRITGKDEIKIKMPVADLDSPSNIYVGILESCKKHVPSVKEITKTFEHDLEAFKHPQSATMLSYLKLVMGTVLCDGYDQDNPGHLFVALQSFGGWWAGVAREIFLRCLRKLYDDRDDLVIECIALICKCFGSTATMPTMPRLPLGGSPPSPISALADYIIGIHPAVARYRDDLHNKIRVWHLPAYIRKHKITNQEEKMKYMFETILKHK